MRGRAAAAERIQLQMIGWAMYLAGVGKGVVMLWMTRSVGSVVTRTMRETKARGRVVSDDRGGAGSCCELGIKTKDWTGPVRVASIGAGTSDTVVT